MSGRKFMVAIPVALVVAAIPVVRADAVPLQGAGVYEVDYSYDSADCSVTSASGPTDVNYATGASGRWVHKKSTFKATFTATADSTDVSRLTEIGDVRARRVVRAGAVRSIEVKGTISAKVTAPSTSVCAVDGQPAVQSALTGRVTRDTWVVTSVSTRTPLSSTYQFVMSPASGPPDLSILTAGNISTGSTVKLDAGSQITLNQTLLFSSEASASGSASLPFSMSAKFFDVGEAAAAAVGSGRSYLALPSHLSCADKSLAVPFTGRAKSVRSAVVTVNGRKKASVKGPFGKGLALSLTGIKPTSKSVVKSTLTLKSGKKVTASRTYLPCA